MSSTELRLKIDLQPRVWRLFVFMISTAKRKELEAMSSKKRISLFIALLLFWFALSGTIDLRQIILGTLSALASLLLYEWVLNHAKIKPLKPMPPVRWLRLIKITLHALFTSSIDQILRIFSGNDETVFIQILLDHDHPYITTIIANVITLTPGAVSVEADGNLLKILMFAPKNEADHSKIYKLVDQLQSVFGRCEP